MAKNYPFAKKRSTPMVSSSAPNSYAGAASQTKQSTMVAKKIGGNPMQPTPSPTTTQPFGKVVASTGVVKKKVAKVEAVKKKPEPARKLNKPAIKKVVKK